MLATRLSDHVLVVTGDYLDDDRFTHASAPDEHARRHAIRSAIAAPLMGDAGPQCADRITRS